jgi:TolB protein
MKWECALNGQRKKLVKKIVILLFSLIACPKFGYTLVYIDIDAPAHKKIPIAISHFEGDMNRGMQARTLLESDLDYTGFFEILPPEAFLEERPDLNIDFKKWQLIGAHLLIKGKVETKKEFLTLEIRLYDVNKGVMLIGKRFKGKAKTMRHMIHKFADAMMEVITGEASIFQTKIAFVYKEKSTNNIKEVYLSDFDGYKPCPLTSFYTICLSPKWHPKDKKLLFTSYKNSNPEVYLLDLVKAKALRLIHCSNLNITPAWSPDGNVIAVTLVQDKKQGIYLVDNHGKMIKRLLQSSGINVSPSWSPDGKKIAFVSDRGGSPQIYVFDLVHKEIRRLTFEGGYNTSPAWSPKGDYIAYTGLKDGHYQIFVIDLEGNKIRQLTYDETSHESPSWSPDGRFLAYSQNKRIYILRLIDGSSFPILPLPGEQFQPNWSPRLK